LIIFLIANSGSIAPVQADPQEKVTLGQFKSRAIFGKAAKSVSKSPVVILIPGSGPVGPEAMIPARLTKDGKDHAIFSELSSLFQSKGVHTLSLGKPGVEYFKGWDLAEKFYDPFRFLTLKWKDLVDNVDDAFQFVKSHPGVDPRRIYLLGMSEGSQVAFDYAKKNPSVKGLIFIGYFGEDFSTVFDWQLFQRPMQHWIKTDIDGNHDGFITRTEAKRWREFKDEWWPPRRKKVTVAELWESIKRDPNLKRDYQVAKKSVLYSDVFQRGSIHEELSKLPQETHIINGALDMITPPQYSEAARIAFKIAGRTDNSVQIVPNVGHVLSAPQGKRAHPLLDATYGPIDPKCNQLLRDLAQKIVTGQ
jgi:pimeloyl-ACP methyl ester carboxylesterase